MMKNIAINISQQMTTTVESVREEGLDKFYTIPAISEKCLERIGSRYKWAEWGVVIEPSAGNGSFLTRIPTSNKVGIDISPEHKDIIKQDFLTYDPPSNIGKILVVGNPPFGRVSSLAIKFFNHASKWADVIAFIVPRTFRRVSVHNKLNTNFHLVFDEDIPMEPSSFSPPMKAKCCFQIWEKKDAKRTIIELSTKHDDWDFLKFGPKDAQGQPTPPTGADFAMRAYGGKCGEIVVTGLDTLRPKSWHWIKSNIHTHILIERFNALDYTLSLDTARQNSLGRGELVRLYSETHD
jgi:predicted RNA methylase